MDAIELVRRIIGNGAEPMTADKPSDVGDWVCFFCDGQYEYKTRPDRFEPHHAPDCLWLAAKAYLEDHDALVRIAHPEGILNIAPSLTKGEGSATFIAGPITKGDL